MYETLKLDFSKKMESVQAELQQTVELMAGVKSTNFEYKEKIESLESLISQRDMDGENLNVSLDRAVGSRKEIEAEMTDLRSAFISQEEQRAVDVLVLISPV
jgi:chromosome segregation ATPase